MSRVTKGWFVEGLRSNPEAEDGIEKLRSRTYHVYQAAADYADELRKATDKPESVNIRTSFGYDNVDPSFA